MERGIQGVRMTADMFEQKFEEIRRQEAPLAGTD